MGTDLQTRPTNDQHTAISLTPELKSLIAVATDFRYGNPAAPPLDVLPEIRGALAEIDQILGPAPPKKISARVTVLLSHYFVPDLPVQAQVAVLEDWVEALRLEG